MLIEAYIYYIPYIVRKFGGRKFDKFGESSGICQTKTIQISSYTVKTKYEIHTFLVWFSSLHRACTPFLGMLYIPLV